MTMSIAPNPATKDLHACRVSWISRSTLGSGDHVPAPFGFSELNNPGLKHMFLQRSACAAFKADATWPKPESH